MSKVTRLENPQGLMTIVPITQWDRGIRALISKAKRDDIMPSCIVLAKLDESGEEPDITLMLWGDK